MKGYLLTGRYQPFVQIGAGFVAQEFLHVKNNGDKDVYKKTNFALRAGGGLDFYATKNIVVNVNVDYLLPPTLNLNYLSISIILGSQGMQLR